MTRLATVYGNMMTGHCDSVGASRNSRSWISAGRERFERIAQVAPQVHCPCWNPSATLTRQRPTPAEQADWQKF